MTSDNRTPSISERNNYPVNSKKIKHKDDYYSNKACFDRIMKRNQKWAREQESITRMKKNGN